MSKPMEVNENNKKEKNVLIISMSTLKEDSAENNYYFIDKNNEDKKLWYRGQYSMVPGTKHILNYLGEKNRKLDRIIMLSTLEAKGQTKDKNGNIVDKEGFVNAVNHYKEKIKEFIKTENTEEAIDDQVVKQINNNKEYLNDNLEKLFVDIELNSVETSSAYEKIPEVVEKVLEFKDAGTKINLFLDMQGGARVSTFIINAAVNMLRDEDTRLECSYAIAYEPGKTEHQLSDESLSNYILDMVSGMDEFLNYGRAKKFEKYFKHYKEIRNVTQCEEDCIVTSMNKISNAISICNIKGFYKGLDELEKKIKEYNEPSKQKDAIFKTFIEKIKKEYEGILSSERRRAIDVMKWCLEKEWYQQALTVCEAKMPEQMIREKVVYYDEKFLAKFANYYSLNQSKLEHVKDSSIFVFKNYMHEFNDKTRAEGSWEDLIKEGELLSDYKDEEKLYQVLLQYTQLAGLRNQINHVGQSVKLKKLIDKMNRFIDNYNALVGTCEEINDYVISMDEIKEFSNEGK